MTDSNKELAQEQEYLRADLDLLRQEVDSISQHMKQVKQLLITTDMILKDILESR